jgi:hypothetical protein
MTPALAGGRRSASSAFEPVRRGAADSRRSPVLRFLPDPGYCQVPGVQSDPAAGLSTMPARQPETTGRPRGRRNAGVLPGSNPGRWHLFAGAGAPGNPLLPFSPRCQGGGSIPPARTYSCSFSAPRRVPGRHLCMSPHHLSDGRRVRVPAGAPFLPAPHRRTPGHRAKRSPPAPECFLLVSPGNRPSAARDAAHRSRPRRGSRSVAVESPHLSFLLLFPAAGPIPAAGFLGEPLCPKSCI